MPLFAVAVLASLLAERSTLRGLGNKAVGDDPTGLTFFIGSWFLIRSLYVVSYIQIADHTTSFIRSTFWGLGSGLAFWQIYKAAEILGA